MKQNDLQALLSTYLTKYLPSQKNLSTNTISSYCDTFKLLLNYCVSVKSMRIEKMQLVDISDTLIYDFLEWLIKERGCSVSTINQRIACIHSFFRYVQLQQPGAVLQCGKILLIPIRKKPQPLISYLSADQTRLLLSQPGTSSRKSRRDIVLLNLLYDTGARVQELCDLKISSLRLTAPAQISLFGKGRKTRFVPLMDNTVKLLEMYLNERRLNAPDKIDHPLFFSSNGSKLTRAGVSYILAKYISAARLIDPSIPEKVTPHMLRHSKAMHLLQAGVHVVYIRDILGHENISTTAYYAKADLQMKRLALSKTDTSKNFDSPFWVKDDNLLDWLNNLGKSLN
jgi:integrase/recombinase XerD